MYTENTQMWSFAVTPIINRDWREWVWCCCLCCGSQRPEEHDLLMVCLTQSPLRCWGTPRWYGCRRGVWVGWGAFLSVCLGHCVAAGWSLIPGSVGVWGRVGWFAQDHAGCVSSGQVFQHSSEGKKHTHHHYLCLGGHNFLPPLHLITLY